MSANTSDFSDADFNTVLLHSYLGKAITNWNTLEELLFYIFNSLMDGPIEVSAAILAPLTSFAARFEIIHSVARLKLESRPELPFWNSLHQYILELNGDRNRFAHFLIIRPDEDGQAPFLSGPRAHALAKRDKPNLDTDELRELTQDIQECLDYSVTLLAHLNGQIERAPEFWKPISRRRLPRKERLAGNHPKP